MGMWGGIAAAIVGTVVGVASTMHQARQQQKMARAQGKAQQAMANYNAQVSENTAIAAQQTAKMEKVAASERSDRQQRANKELMARQQAMQMKTGGTFGGSALLVEEDQLAEMKLQELDLLHQGELRAREHKLQAMGAEASAVGSRFQGTQAREMADYRGRSLMTMAQIQSGAMIAAPRFGGFGGSRAPAKSSGSYSYASNPGGSTAYNPNKRPKGSVWGTGE